MIKEEWKFISGYEGRYMVSNFGRIKTLNYHRSGKEGFMKPFSARGGYLVIDLLDGNGKSGRKTHYVHRLVAEAFIPNPNNLTEINHKNEDKTDNRVENLEWCDRSYNVNYGKRNQKAFETLTKTNTSKKPKPVLQYSLDGDFIAEWPSACEVQRQLGFRNSSICLCCNGKCKQSHGFIWKYKET